MMSSKDTRKAFQFYFNWCDMINDYYDEGDTEAAALLSLAITRLASTGELIKLPRKDLDRMLQYCISSGLISQEEHYIDGKKGGRPKCLSPSDDDTIYQMRLGGMTAEQIANQLGCGIATVKRNEGWKRAYQNSVSKSHIVSKPVSYQNQNQEKEEEEEEEKEKENLSSDWIESRVTELRHQGIDQTRAYEYAKLGF